MSSRLSVATDDGAIDLGYPTHGREVHRVTRRRRPTGRHRRCRPDGRHRRDAVGAVRQSTASCSTAGPTCIRSPAPCTWTTRSTGSSPASASPTSSRRSRDPLTGFGCWINTMRVLAEFRRDTARSVQRLPAGQHVRPARVRGAAAQQPQAPPACRRFAATSRSPASPSRATDASGSTFDRPDRRLASTSSRPTTCSAATAPTASFASSIGTADARSQVRATLAGRRRRHRRRPRPVGRRAPGVRPGPRGHLHAHRPYPLPVGVPAAAR